MFKMGAKRLIEIVKALDCLCSGKKDVEGEIKQLKIVVRNGYVCFITWNENSSISFKEDTETKGDNTIIVNPRNLLDVIDVKGNPNVIIGEGNNEDGTKCCMVKVGQNDNDIRKVPIEEQKKTPIRQKDEDGFCVKVLRKDLAQAILMAVECQTTGSQMQIMRDTYLQLEEDGLAASGTNGYRLCRKKVEAIDINEEKTGSFFINGVIAKAIGRSLDLGNGEIDVHWNGKDKISICNGNFIAVAKTSEGCFLNFDKFLKINYPFQICMNRCELGKSFANVCKGEGYKTNFYVIVDNGTVIGPKKRCEVKEAESVGNFNPVAVKANILEAAIMGIKSSEIILKHTREGIVLFTSPDSDDCVYLTTKAN